MPDTAAHARNRRRLAAGLAALLLGLAIVPLSAARPGAAVGASPAASSTLVVNEVDYRQPGAPDDAEFVEIKNVGTGAIDVAGYDLALVDVNGTVYWRQALAVTPTLLAAGAYYVLCDDAGRVPGCHRAIKGWTLQDASDSQSFANAVAIILRAGGVRADLLVDSVAYDGVVPGTFNGQPWTETLAVSPADDDSDAHLGISRDPDGRDNDANSRDFQLRCVTPGGANTGDKPPCQPPPTATPTPTATATRGPSPTATQTATDVPKPTATDAGPKTLVLVVDDAGNEADLQPGDDQCDAGRKCTLRAALMEANATRHQGPLVIRFAASMEVPVPPNDPLPALTRGEVTLTGVKPGTAGNSMAPWVGVAPYDGAASGPSVATGSSATAGAGPEQLPVVWLHGPGASSGLVGLDLDDASGVRVQGLLITGFGVGVWLHGGGTGNVVGVVPDGQDDELEGNVIAENGQAEVRLGDTSGNVIAGNRLGADIGGRQLTVAGVELTDGAASNLVGVRVVRGETRGAPNRIQWRHRYGVWIHGGGVGDNFVSGNIIGAERAEDGPDAGNGLGIWIAEGAAANTIGGDGDGEGGLEEANLIAFNLVDGIHVDALSIDNIVRGNLIHSNGQNGVRLARTARGGTWLAANRITHNGAAAIAFGGDGYEPPPPVVAKVTDLGAGKWLAQGQACAGCVVEVFTDPSDEAGTLQGGINADGVGQWQLVVTRTTADDTSVNATVRGADGATSRLSPAKPLDPASLWRLHAVPPPNPRALRGAQIDRRYRLYNEQRRPVPDAEVRFTPLGWRFVADANGYVDVRIPVNVAAAFLSRGMSFTVEAVARDDGLVHPVVWRPAMAVALEQTKETSPDVILDLSSLTAAGIGALLKRPGGTFAQAGSDIRLPALAPAPAAVSPAPMSPATNSGATDRQTATLPAACVAPARAASLAAEDAVGAAWTASADVSLREGDYAWQENIARGGALYELKAGSEALEGELEIRAPIAAWNVGGAASGCEPPGQGAVMCGWRRDKGCWVPIGSSAVSAPSPGAETVAVRANVSVPSAGTSVMARISAGEVYTLYTVGFDVTAPVITPTLASGAIIAALPAVLAEAVDEHAGVDALDGVQVLFDGELVPVVYDPGTRRILVPESSRTLPAGALGPADIVIRVTDGFCNLGQSLITVILNPNAPPTHTPTPTRTVSATSTYTPTFTPTPLTTPVATVTSASPSPVPPVGVIYLPFCLQRRTTVR